MSRQLKIILLALLGIFVGIQLFPSGRPANSPVEGYDFFSRYQVPREVEQLIRTSCFDCHSQEVNYPWYAHVAPISWLVSRDVRNGRSHLDFSNWASLEKKEKIQLAGEIGEEVEDGIMPMAIYVYMHSEAMLDQDQRDLIVEWAEGLAEQIFEE